jgi:hypothetical protein
MRALFGGIALVLALGSPARADGCPPSSVDVADWPIVRSARVPGFTLRLPRTFTRDSAATAGDSTPIARWSDAARGRFMLSHRAAGGTSALDPGVGERASATRCETLVGSATATIVSYDEGANAYVMHARIRWPDGEAIDVRADATDREHLDLLLAVVRTVRRAGA